MSFRQATVADLDSILDSIEEGYIEHFAPEKKYGTYTVFRERGIPQEKLQKRFQRHLLGSHQSRNTRFRQALWHMRIDD